MQHAAQWTVKAQIDKFDSYQSFKLWQEHKIKKAPDEILILPNNTLTAMGVNCLWSLVSGKTYEVNGNVETVDQGISSGTGGASVKFWKPFSHKNSYIAVGDANKAAGAAIQAVSPQDLNLFATTNYMFMGMDQPTDAQNAEDYPLSGDNQKITFKSTFPPGVATFEWLEWGISNGNGNGASFTQDQFWTESGNTSTSGDKPDPVPTLGIPETPETGHPCTGLGRNGTDSKSGQNFVLLNHRQEAMGVKNVASTWIVTCEISLQ